MTLPVTPLFLLLFAKAIDTVDGEVFAGIDRSRCNRKRSSTLIKF